MRMSPWGLEVKKKIQENDVEKFIDFKMSSGSEEERKQEACKWWGQGEGDFFRVGKEKFKKTSRKEEEKQIILQEGGREGG